MRLIKIDKNNNRVQSSDDEDYEAVRELPAAKRVKLLAESKEKSEAKAEVEDESEDYSSDSDSN